MVLLLCSHGGEPPSTLGAGLLLWLLWGHSCLWSMSLMHAPSTLTGVPGCTLGELNFGLSLGPKKEGVDLVSSPSESFSCRTVTPG